ncbi:ATP-binding protein [Curtobacterium sp. RRHDQ10]|uniref:ATP-binding protein n=1 Tax=Curtobacterium phyllosphaerae TaxID=3413379 RepID=UPI003BF0EFF9
MAHAVTGVLGDRAFLDADGAPVPLNVLVAEAHTASRPVVLVDGRSGTGKTTLAGGLAAALGAELVHLDDVYPGWDGLRAAADAVVRDVLGGSRTSAGRGSEDLADEPVPPQVPEPTPRPGWRRYDWGAGLQAEWHALDPTRPLVVEGCGALSRGAAPRATLRIWLDGEDATRRRRALDRDGAVFAREWERWAAQERAFIREEDPMSLADRLLHLP